VAVGGSVVPVVFSGSEGGCVSRVPRDIVISVDQVDDVLFQTHDGRLMRAVRWNLSDEGNEVVRQGYVCLLCLGDLPERFGDCPICTPCHGYCPGTDQMELYAKLYLGEFDNPEDTFLEDVGKEEFAKTAHAVQELNEAFSKAHEEKADKLGVMTFDGQAENLERAAWRKKSGIWVPGNGS